MSDFDGRTSCGSQALMAPDSRTWIRPRVLSPRHGWLIWASSARRAGRTCAIWRCDALTGRRPLSSLRLSGVLPLRLDERALRVSFQWLPPRSTRPRFSGTCYPIRDVEKERASGACARAGTRFRPAIAAGSRARTSFARGVHWRISPGAGQKIASVCLPVPAHRLRWRLRCASHAAAVLRLANVFSSRAIG